MRWGFSSSGRALGSQSKGGRFESGILHFRGQQVNCCPCIIFIGNYISVDSKNDVKFCFFEKTFVYLQYRNIYMDI